ncbi:MAG: anion permease, partial [Prevotellaceae bacterium]|nr:anion permease [Prevotellaceae bacterium]
MSKFDENYKKMTTAAIITLVTLFLTVFLFVSNKLRSDLVALLSLLSLLLFNILTPEEALAGFSSTVVIMMIGLFVVGGAIFETGLAQTIGNKLLLLAGGSHFKIFALVILATSSIGGFVSNTGVVALMMPIVVSLAMSAKMSSSRLLMPLAFVSSMGGMLTLIGTPPNLIIHDTLIRNGYEGLSFFSFLPVGLISIALGMPLLWFLSKWFLSKKESTNYDENKGRTPQSLVNQYHLVHNLYRLRVKADSPFVDRQIGDINIRSVYNINVLEIRRRSEKYIFSHVEHQVTPTPHEVIRKNDVLYAMGDFDDVKKMLSDNDLDWVDTVKPGDTAPVFSEKLQFAEIGIAEIVIMSNSRLIDQYIVDSGFRENYNLNVLGIQRNNRYILKGLKNEKIHSGDALLVQGDWADISRLRKEDDSVVVVGQDASEETSPKLLHKAPLAGFIMLAMIVAMSFNWLPPVAAVMLAAILMVLTGCLRNVESAYEKINWQSIVL